MKPGPIIAMILILGLSLWLMSPTSSAARPRTGGTPRSVDVAVSCASAAGHDTRLDDLGRAVGLPRPAEVADLRVARVQTRQRPGAGESGASVLTSSRSRSTKPGANTPSTRIE